MNELTPGPGWWLASDGNWYPPEAYAESDHQLMFAEGSDRPEGPEWWQASDGKWYSPAFRSASHPDERHALEQDIGATSPGNDPNDTVTEEQAQDQEQGRARFDPSVSRRYMGFVPELGPEPEIRPELREPLFSPRPTEDLFASSSDAFTSSDASGAGSTEPLQSTETAGMEAGSDLRPTPRRGPRHGRHKRRWFA